MPIFTKNYNDTKKASIPESIQLEYNKPDLALAMFEAKINKLILMGLSPAQIEKIRALVRHLSTRLANNEQYKINLGPAYAVSVLYDSTEDASDIFITYNPFGGGTFDALGLDKVWFPNEPKDYIEKSFTNLRSTRVEEELFNEIRTRLLQGA